MLRELLPQIDVVVMDHCNARAARTVRQFNANRSAVFGVARGFTEDPNVIWFLEMSIVEAGSTVSNQMGL